MRKPLSTTSKLNKAAGFTLVEVMVALLVVAVSISAILTQIMTTVDSTARLRDKTIANWVALNQLELMYIANANPSSPTFNRLVSRETTGKEEMVGRQWFWRIKPLEGDAEKSVQLQVTVTRSEDDDSALVSFIGVIDAFHQP